MNKNYKIKCENISKIYNLNKSKKEKVLSLLTLGKFNTTIPFYALHNINFSVASGDSIGIIGLNGSGKSTLSNILGGVSEPTTGRIISKSRPSLIAIGAGLKNEFNGIENIQYKCLMHGMSQKEINKNINSIIDFSELDEFIYQPLKSYSSGMRSRLGFAIAIHTNPDILIVDEALSVGDETFSNKCITKMKELQNDGKTIFFVSHSTTQIKKMCNKAMWIHYGKLVDLGDVDSIIRQYNDFIKKYKALSKSDQLSYKQNLIKSQKKISRSNKIPTSKLPKFSISLVGFFFCVLLYLIKIQLGF